jgi:hypothetical protein
MKATMKTELDWEVQTQEIELGGHVLKDRVALIRSDNQEVLGIRSKNYHPFFNRNMQELVDRITDFGGFQFKGFEEFGGGKKILAFFQNKQGNLKLCGQDVKDYLILGNSHDASSKLFVGTSNYMFRCENQFSEKIRTFERRHDAVVSANEIPIERIIRSYEMGRESLYSRMEKFGQVKIDLRTIQALKFTLFDSVIELKDTVSVMQVKETTRSKKFDEAVQREMSELGSTLWGLFNGVTRFTSAEIGNSFGNTSGAAEKMNRAAMKFCMEQLVMAQN